MLHRLEPKQNTAAVQIRFLNPDNVTDPLLVEHLRGWLNKQEQSRLARFIRPADRHQFLVSHALVRRLLGEHLDCSPHEVQFGTTARNKPQVTHPRCTPAVHFNLSHTHGLTVVAVSTAPIGVDAEWLDRQTPAQDLAARYFTANELSDIKGRCSVDSQRRFLTYWTLKEAFLKAEGWGIVDRLDGFEFELAPNAQWPPAHIRLRVRHALSFPTRPWRFYQWHIQPGHLVSLAACARQTQEMMPDMGQWHEHDWAI